MPVCVAQQVGGNDGKQTMNDAWALDTSEKPYQWRKITDSGEQPPPRWVGGGAGVGAGRGPRAGWRPRAGQARFSFAQ